MKKKYATVKGKKKHKQDFLERMRNTDTGFSKEELKSIIKEKK